MHSDKASETLTQLSSHRARSLLLSQQNPDIPSEGMSLEDNERLLLARALEKTAGNQTQAARLLRITRDTLRYKMKKFNLR